MSNLISAILCSIISILLLFSCGDTNFEENEAIDRGDKRISIDVIFPVASFFKYNKLFENTVCQNKLHEHHVELINDDGTRTTISDEFEFSFDTESVCVINWKANLKIGKSYYITLFIQKNENETLFDSVMVVITEDTEVVTISLRESVDTEKIENLNFPEPPIIDPSDGVVLKPFSIKVNIINAPILKNSGCSFVEYYYDSNSKDYQQTFKCFIEFEATEPVEWIQSYMTVNDEMHHWGLKYLPTDNPFYVVATISSKRDGFYGAEDSYKFIFSIHMKDGSRLYHAIYF